MEKAREWKQGDFYITIEFLFSWNCKNRYGVTCRSKHHDLVVDRIVKKRDIKSAIQKCQMDLLAAELNAEGDSPVFQNAWMKIKPEMMRIKAIPGEEVNSRMIPTTYGYPN